MKMFLAGVIAAVVVAVVTGWALDQADVASAVFNSTDNVRL